jgi:glycogen operon protein
MRRSRRTEDGAIETVSLLLNAGDEPLDFVLPPPALARRVLVDSAHPDAEEHEVEDSYRLEPHAAALLLWTRAEA